MKPVLVKVAWKARVHAKDMRLYFAADVLEELWWVIGACSHLRGLVPKQVRSHRVGGPTTVSCFNCRPKSKSRSAPELADISLNQLEHAWNKRK